MFFDIGGGNGYVAKGLIEAGIACALIEPGIDGAVAARARGIDPVICARLEDAELPPASIAAAGMFDVLEHIEDEAAALRRVHGLLRPGGRLFLTVPAYQFLFSVDDRIAGHFRRYTIASLTGALLESGFRVELASYMFAPLPPLVFRAAHVADQTWPAPRDRSGTRCGGTRSRGDRGALDGLAAQGRIAPDPCGSVITIRRKLSVRGRQGLKQGSPVAHQPSSHSFIVVPVCLLRRNRHQSAQGPCAEAGTAN